MKCVSVVALSVQCRLMLDSEVRAADMPEGANINVRVSKASTTGAAAAHTVLLRIQSWASERVSFGFVYIFFIAKCLRFSRSTPKSGKPPVTRVVCIADFGASNV